MLKPVIVALSMAIAVAGFSRDSVSGVDTGVAFSAAAPAQHDHSTPSAVAAPQATTSDTTQMHQHMMSEMKAADAKLDGLMKDMHAATGEAKVSAMAQVVTELVRQQHALHQRMASTDHCMTMMSGHGGMMKR